MTKRERVTILFSCLNYDSQVKKTFSDFDRMFIHTEIHHTWNNRNYLQTIALEDKIQKLSKILTEIKY